MVKTGTVYDLLRRAKEYDREGNLDMAIVFYEQVLALPGEIEAHQEARRRMSILIEEAIQDTANLRMDVVMHCMNAIETFSDMDRRGIGLVLQEIARRGRNGVLLGDTSRRYQIETLGTELEGLAMVVYMFTGIRMLGYPEDLGLDFRPEYEMAKRFAGSGPGGSSTIH